MVEKINQPTIFSTKLKYWLMDDKCVVDKNNNTNDVELLGW